MKRREPIRFTRGSRQYVIAPAYGGYDQGFVGLCDGRVVAQAMAPAEVARALIRASR